MENVTTAIKATYADFKLVKTRSVAQIILEIPIENAKQAIDYLSLPNPQSEQWVGIALMKRNEDTQSNALRSSRSDEGSDKSEPRKWNDMPYAQRAGILSNSTDFHNFLRETEPELWMELLKGNNGYVEASAFYIRDICRVTSRADIEKIDTSKQAFDALNNSFTTHRDYGDVA